jgi:hypothetical protein
MRRPTQHAHCKKCGTWFPISKELDELIQDGIIHAIDINLCPICAERAEEEAILQSEFDYQVNF